MKEKRKEYQKPSLNLNILTNPPILHYSVLAFHQTLFWGNDSYVWPSHFWDSNTFPHLFVVYCSTGLDQVHVEMCLCTWHHLSHLSSLVTCPNLVFLCRFLLTGVSRFPDCFLCSFGHPPFLCLSSLFNLFLLPHSLLSLNLTISCLYISLSIFNSLFSLLSYPLCSLPVPFFVTPHLSPASVTWII